MREASIREIRERARHRCEYCALPEAFSEFTFTIDHIVARQHGGLTTTDNLALCCGFCNRHKGPNLAGIDSQSGMLIPLFHPRRDRWVEHFRWEREILVGLTPTGRATI